jgi:DNA-binding beta-propeller fold protein YncE
MRFAACVCILSAVSMGSAAEKLVLFCGGDKANFKEPFGMDFLPDGSIVVVEFSGHKVSRVDKDGKATVFAGAGKKGRADGPAAMAEFNGPHNLAVAKDGTVYVADTLNHLVRKIDPKTRSVSTIAGTGKPGFGGDGGPALAAQFNQTFHVALDAGQENLYVADLGNVRVRKIDLKTGIVTTVAGNGTKAVPADGAKAAESPLVDPRSCAVDSKGRLFILERGGHALRVVENGLIRTVAGTGKAGAGGDGGPGVKASLRGPKLIWVDTNDDVLIADAENSLIRKFIAKDGTIVRIAGAGKKGDSGLDGPPLEAAIARPHGVAQTPDGTIWIVDSYNSRILKIQK